MKIRQEIGRLIRSESDIGVAIILDKRSAYFRHEIPDMLLSEDPLQMRGGSSNLFRKAFAIIKNESGIP